jgi:radical SAM superfamily enzyme YgiQ (UPF0313 family)
MKLELISPAHVVEENKKGRRFFQLGLAIIAALTPPDIEVEVTEEDVEKISYKPVDLVGLSLMTSQAPGGYRIADEYRRRGVAVVLGGMHPSALPQEAIQHADAVVIGEGENVWGQLIEDFKMGRLKKFYQSKDWASMQRIPYPSWHLFKGGTTLSARPIQATRGCPFKCAFCSVAKFFGNSYRRRPIDHVIGEIERTPNRHLFFVDDNIMGHAAYAKELFKRMIPLKKKWGGQVTITVGRDDELLKLAKKSGCMSLFIGIESLSRESLREANKSFNNPRQYEENIKRIHGHGIQIMAGTIFGFDSDDKNVFENMVAFYKQNKVAVANFSVLTPFPGTGTYEKLKAEGRIVDNNWASYTGGTVVFKPKGMSMEDLSDGLNWAIKQFYTVPSFLARYWANRNHPLLYLRMNCDYRTIYRQQTRNENSGGQASKG